MKNDRRISVGGNLVRIGVPVFRWDHPAGFDGYETARVVRTIEDRRTGRERRKVVSGRRYNKRPEGAASIRSFVVHHSGGDGADPSGMYETLHNRRKLSVHFAVEDDGRVYQFLDVEERAWHAGAVNDMSIGAECCLYPAAEEVPGFYNKKRRERFGNLPHRRKVQTIQGITLETFWMPDQQVDALARVIAGCWAGMFWFYDVGPKRFFAPPLFPRNPEITYNYIGKSKAREHVGLLAHLHAARRKWDAAGLDYERLENAVARYYWMFLETGANK